jgi:VanZ family protein
MTWPSKDTLIGAVSGFFGGKESTDAIGHGMLFTVFGLVWWWALHGTVTEPLRTAILLTLIAGVTTEIVQMIVPSRGLSATDLIANVSGALILLMAQSFFRLLKRRCDVCCKQPASRQ